VFLQPFVEVEIVILLGPQHACQGLSMDPALIFGQIGGSDAPIKLVRIRQA